MARVKRGEYLYPHEVERAEEANARKHKKRLLLAVAVAWVVSELSKDKADKSLRAKIVHDFANAVIENGNQMR